MHLHLLIPNLNRGGAERQLVLLAQGLAGQGAAVSVTTLRGGGGFEAELRDSGVTVTHLLGDQGVVAAPLALFRLARRLWHMPGIAYSFLPPMNVLSGLMRFLAPGTKIVWGIRSSDMPLSAYSAKTRIAYGLERPLAPLAHKIITNSRKGKSVCLAKGYQDDKLAVVANGFQTNLFQPDPHARDAMRAAWGLKAADIAIGLPARIDPVKDHRTFLQAAGILAKKHAALRFVIIGGGPEAETTALRDFATQLDLGDKVIWAGETANMPAAFNALDISCLTSISEGFPNTIGEAMACGVPCVGTDVGDVGWLIDDPDRVVPAGNSGALAQAIERILPEDIRHSLGAAARARICQEFSVEALLRNTRQALELPA